MEIPLLSKILMPLLTDSLSDVLVSKRRFVHYTSADAAMGIISNQEIWMRNSSMMNDYTEVLHGGDCLKAAYGSASGELFKKEINSLFPDISVEIEAKYDQWQSSFQDDTYFTCISEHNDDEDDLGRLSMWRAYGNVALVINPQALMLETTNLRAYASPVEYLDVEGVKGYLADVAHNIAQNSEYMKSLTREQILNAVQHSLRFATLCTKHPGFREEKEWRIVYSPSYDNSDIIKKNIEIINRVPQIVCKIPLANNPEAGLVGLEVPELINRVIIGPSDFSSMLREAFISALADAGVEKAEDRVFASDTPLR